MQIRQVVPWLGEGRDGLVTATSADAELAFEVLTRCGYAVVVAAPVPEHETVARQVPEDGSVGQRVALRSEQAAIARALGLPVTAARNLDALVDSLRDVRPTTTGTVLVWPGAGVLRATDHRGHAELTEILQIASREHADRGAVFETIAVDEDAAGEVSDEAVERRPDPIEVADGFGVHGEDRDW